MNNQTGEQGLKNIKEGQNRNILCERYKEIEAENIDQIFLAQAHKVQSHKLQTLALVQTCG